ncbi:tautomerase family protein [Pseudodesulfovibrio thermohalotolerans]|uniref:tautomerase family protein n=1 Tax=Pseudodesulfovibrio thermohalotolerans TaxID=2880651 RepID=UPI002442DFED|nr:tautomerase family protein [Pseudodesulfovibrio thermohalotolerans]WFS61914.1 tautomerase family protein [Pseudodesulfovibrio thermohalotolerans]
MSNKYSRRDFIARGAVGLGAAVAFKLCGLCGSDGLEVAGAIASDGAKEEIMPHVSVKLWPGRSEEDKQRLADAIVEEVVKYTGASRSSVSVSIEEISFGDWKEKVYDPDIRDKADILYKKPGYSM